MGNIREDFEKWVSQNNILLGDRASLAWVAWQAAYLEGKKKSEDTRRLEELLARELGIEKAEPNAGDDPSKEYWIGIDQQCYESLRSAIDAAIRLTTKTPC